MSASLAVPEDQTIVELVPLVYEHATDCDVQIIDGRAYITWTDQRPEGLVAVTKTVCSGEALDRFIERLQMARAQRNAAQARGRSN
jgi:hypothetical protein